jgi:hypothetical protein
VAVLLVLLLLIAGGAGGFATVEHRRRVRAEARLAEALLSAEASARAAAEAAEVSPDAVITVLRQGGTPTVEALRRR